MTRGQRGQPVTPASEDERAEATHGRVDNGWGSLAEFQHVAFCSGPAQLAFLLAAFEVFGISPRGCTIQPYPGSAKNDDLKRTLVEASSLLGMQTTDLDHLPSPTLSDAFQIQNGLPSDRRLAFWYCQGDPFHPRVMYYLQRVMPDRVFEYYDGLGSLIAASEQAKTRVSLPEIRCLGDLKRFSMQRLMQPDKHLMPANGLWERYASPETQSRTHQVPLHTIREKIRLVGDILADIDGHQWPEQGSPDVILIMAKLSEIRREVALEDELRMYNDLLKTVRTAFKSASILAKTHPRSSPEKMDRLREICAEHDAGLYTGQQLIEYVVEKSGRHNVAFIGPPSTSFLSATQFNYGRAFCLSQSFMASYIGPDYGNDSRQTMQHQVMEAAGVPVVNSLSELAATVREHKISGGANLRN